MPYYLLSVYQPDGPTPEPAVLAAISRDLGAINAELKSASAWVFAGGLHAPSTATVVRATGDDVLTTDGPFTEGKEHLGGFTIITAPDLDAALALGREADAGHDVAGGSPAVPGRTGALRHSYVGPHRPTAQTSFGRRDRPRLSRRIRPRGRRTRSHARRHRPRGGRGAGSVRHGGAAVVIGRAPTQSGRLDHHHGAQPRDRPRATRGDSRRTPCAGGAPFGAGRDGRGGCRARRPTPAHLHVLPSGARSSRTGGLDVAVARRAQYGGNRERVHGARRRRWRNGWSAPRARFATHTFPIGCRERRSSRIGWGRFSRSSTSSSTRATRPVPATP